LIQADAAQVAATTKNWIGPHVDEAQSAYQLARERGMTALRARIIGHVGSHKYCSAFRRTIAKVERCAVRTVQRALTQGQDLGLMRAVRSKPGEIIPGIGKPIDCGCSIKWIAGWGKALATRLEQIAKYRARRLVQRATVAAVVVAATAASGQSLKRPSSWDVERDERGHVTVARAPQRPAPRTAAELDAELERRFPRDGPE
jgi:hypothetical protein